MTDTQDLPTRLQTEESYFVYFDKNAAGIKSIQFSENAQWGKVEKGEDTKWGVPPCVLWQNGAGMERSGIWMTLVGLSWKHLVITLSVKPPTHHPLYDHIYMHRDHHHGDHDHQDNNHQNHDHQDHCD